MAEPSENKNKKGRKRLPPSVLEEGRLLGNIARKNPALFKTLEEYAKQTGKKKTVILEEALHHYVLERRIIQSQLSVADLYEAWCILADFQQQAIQNFLDFAKLMFSEEYRSMLELSREIAAPPPRELPPAPPPEKVKAIEERIIDKLWNMFEPMLDWAIEATFKSMFKMTGRKPPRLPTEKKIPVTIEEEEEEPKDKVKIEVK